MSVPNEASQFLEPVQHDMDLVRRRIGMHRLNNAFVMLWLIALIMSIVALLDWWGRRKYRQSKHRSRT